MRVLRFLALVALCLAFIPAFSSAPASAATGYDSAYAGESAFVKINPGETMSFQVFFQNTGSVTWGRGSATQVDLAACLEDKVTCNAQDASEASWNSGWLSPTRYATHTQIIVQAGQLATFSYSIHAPSDATGPHRFNGDLVVAATGQRIHPEGYYQEATVEAIGSIAVPTPTPTRAPTPTPGSTPFPSPAPVQPTATPRPTVNPNPLTCFDGTTDGGFNGHCTITGAASARLDATDNDTNPNNQYAGVYYPMSAISGRPVAAVDPSSISFSYVAGTGTTASGGSPRVTVPIDTDNNGTWDRSLFADTLGCNDGSAEHGTLSFADATCTMSLSTGETFPNWASFVAANPTFKIATNPGGAEVVVPFVIADQPGLWNVSNVRLGQ